MIVEIELLLSIDGLHRISVLVRLRDSSKVGNCQALLQFRLIFYFSSRNESGLIMIYQTQKSKILTGCASQGPTVRSISRATLQKLMSPVHDLRQERPS